MAEVYGAIDVDAESGLRALGRPLTGADAAAAARLPPVRLAGRLPDLSHDGTWTRQRGAGRVAAAPERFSSELYPVEAPPMHKFSLGAQTRMLGREPNPVSR